MTVLKSFRKNIQALILFYRRLFAKKPITLMPTNLKVVEAHFMEQINELVRMLDKYPFLVPHLTDVDTVGDERELYRKEHFNEMQSGFRKLQYRGFKNPFASRGNLAYSKKRHSSGG